MTGPGVQVDSDQLQDNATRFYRLAPELDGTQPTSGGGPWPSVIGVHAVSGAAGAAMTDQQGKLAALAGSSQANGAAYATQEGKSAGTLKDGTGPMADVAGTLGEVTGSVIPFATEGISFGGQMISTAASSAFQTIQQVTSAVRGTGGSPSGASPGAGIGLPPADQTPNGGVPDEDHHGVTAAAPVAAIQELPEHQVARPA